jgi:Domain of unknown function (DUF4287)
MSFQAYLDNIKAKTGKTPEDFKVLAEQKGLLGEGVKTGQIVAWLKEDFGLGRGHAMAIVLTLRSGSPPPIRADQQAAKHVRGHKARRQKPGDE